MIAKSKKNNHFELLVENAIDFMNKSLEDLKNDSMKYSVINFYTSVELFLKARLLKEHWSLIVTKDPDISKFEQGDFVSITFDTSYLRIDKILNSPLDQKTIDHIKCIKQHRNSMVHFFHKDCLKNKNKLLFEQLNAWYDVNRLLTKDWKSHFEKYILTIEKINITLMSKYEPYINRHYEVIYDSQKLEIEKMIANGTILRNCGICNKTALRTTVFTKNIKTYECTVCKRRDTFVETKCPNCKKPITINSPDSGSSSCEFCDTSITYTHSDLKKLLENNPLRGDYDIGCSDCATEDSLISINKKYFCTNCFEIHDEIGECDWCGASSSGAYNSEEASGLYGCAFCSGNQKIWEDRN